MWIFLTPQGHSLFFRSTSCNAIDTAMYILSIPDKSISFHHRQFCFYGNEFWLHALTSYSINGLSSSIWYSIWYQRVERNNVLYVDLLQGTEMTFDSQGL